MLTAEEIGLMSYEDRLRLAEVLVESVPADFEIEIPQWQADILEERLKHSIEHPDEGIPLDQLMKDLENRRRDAAGHR